jgi:ABC-type Fe3+/spermidine/putrescine transport system ATPase subunit
VPGPELEQRVQWALELVRLRGLEGRYPRQLSGGQQQRVAVARAIVIRPSVLLFDEPLSNLDARLRQEMRGELRQLQRALRIATIFVTHDQEEALSMADRIVVMNAGSVEQVGTPEQIYEEPGSKFVAEFIGECNFLPGRLTVAEGETALFTTTGGLSFRISTPSGAVAGTAGTVAIRPEAITLVPEGAEPPHGANLVSAQLQVSSYLGHFRHLRFRLDSGHELLVYEQTGARSLAWRVEDSRPVRLAWPPDVCTFQAETRRETRA